ncbi:MAG: thioredoxin domain-containing protein [Actinomycetota bacterium]
MSEDRRPNRLAEETSPYLLQHAFNPVDWYPWGREALEKAAREDKPILLSIGYAACHWCHVMEQESFEDEQTARLMNEHFVPVKVDREERPDLDSIYMDAVQSMTGHGGWPMTIFLSPDGSPFYAGTYFPNEDRHGLPAFTKVLGALAEAWRDQRAKIVEQGRRVVGSIERAGALRASNDPLSEDVLLQAHAALSGAFDPRWGGFGGAPKFPQPMTLEFLLRCHVRGYTESLQMVDQTLEKMAAGGIYDHLGGGFHRYSVDERWHVPHFEKMLYDNAQLARLFVRAWQVTDRNRYRRVAQETLEYLLREMRHPGGAFFSSQDADTEGEEGRFFAWSHDELVKVAEETAGSESLGRSIVSFFGATPEGNWEVGKNVLWTPISLQQAALEAGVLERDLAAAVEEARRRLCEIRGRRVRPGTDDKVLSAWNGLAIAALAEAGRAFGESRYVEAAVQAADFVLSNLRRADGRLLRSWRDGRTGGPGYLDDYAQMSQACLTLYETIFDLRFLREARALADDMVRLFRDAEGGGFFQTGSDAEALVVRPRELFDNAVPSGNSVAADVLQRLALLTGETEYERAGITALRLVRDQMARAPTMFGHALCALDFYLSQVREVAIIGDPAGEDTRRLVHEVHGRYLPNSVLAVAAADDREAPREVGLLKDRAPLDGKATAFVCERFECQLPVTEPDALRAQLIA